MNATTLTAAALTAIALVSAPLAGCKSDYEKRTDYQADKYNMERDAKDAIAEFKRSDPSIDRFFTKSAGYVVFPEIAKGGAIIGGAHGSGVVYDKGGMIGYAEMSQGSIGAQLGGQTFSEIIFFENMTALNHFKSGHTEFSGNASAVAADAGAAATADYKDGVAVFTKPRAGLMFEASIGGQQFDYYPR